MPPLIIKINCQLIPVVVDIQDGGAVSLDGDSDRFRRIIMKSCIILILVIGRRSNHLSAGSLSGYGLFVVVGLLAVGSILLVADRLLPVNNRVLRICLCFPNRIDRCVLGKLSAECVIRRGRIRGRGPACELVSASCRICRFHCCGIRGDKLRGYIGSAVPGGEEQVMS